MPCMRFSAFKVSSLLTMLDVRSRHRHGKFLALASPTLQTGIEMGVGKGGVYRGIHIGVRYVGSIPNGYWRSLREISTKPAVYQMILLHHKRHCCQSRTWERLLAG